MNTIVWQDFFFSSKFNFDTNCSKIYTSLSAIFQFWPFLIMILQFVECIWLVVGGGGVLINFLFVFGEFTIRWINYWMDVYIRINLTKYANKIIICYSREYLEYHPNYGKFMKILFWRKLEMIRTVWKILNLIIFNKKVEKHIVLSK